MTRETSLEHVRLAEQNPKFLSKGLSYHAGVSSLLVDSLFSEIQQQRLPAEVQSVYVTAFQIMNETIQDLLHTHMPVSDSKQQQKKGDFIG